MKADCSGVGRRGGGVEEAAASLAAAASDAAAPQRSQELSPPWTGAGVRDTQRPLRRRTRPAALQAGLHQQDGLEDGAHGLAHAAYRRGLDFGAHASWSRCGGCGGPPPPAIDASAPEAAGGVGSCGRAMRVADAAGMAAGKTTLPAQWWLRTLPLLPQAVSGSAVVGG